MATSTTTLPPAEDRPHDAPAGASNAPRPQDVRRLAERVAGGAHALVDRTVERLAPTAERLRTGADQASQTLQARAEEFGALQERLATDSRASVREHPLTWVAAAFVVGMVLGRLCRD